jgi:hypothetical protein
MKIIKAIRTDCEGNEREIGFNPKKIVTAHEHQPDSFHPKPYVSLTLGGRTCIDIDGTLDQLIELIKKGETHE